MCLIICSMFTSDDAESTHSSSQNSRQNLALHLITSEAAAESKITVVIYLQV